ncbi:FHA domain-containing protein [Pseudomonas sp. B21-031]|jgi:type VI secretion system FHA domain protein|uniref:FHA domain-containing protein n=1 Tax=Pseudomonas TaxID=286 RepID=UPI00215EB9BA|nr:FHA domain-containing protein [Pseudomonas sp. B21-031]UVL64450.1 FHA domain-containing protein [Pseudomonas sp. B21-031]
MSPPVIQPSLTLSILNPEQLLHGSEPQHRFDIAGGTIGSQGTWQLHDRQTHILPVHCEIAWHEGHFCIIDHSGKSFMNGSDTGLLSGTFIRLRHNDRLHIGTYQIAIRLFNEDAVRPEHCAAKNPLTALLTTQLCPLQALGTPMTDTSRFLQPVTTAPVDELDPLALLDRAAEARIDPAIARIFGKEAR